MGKKDRRIIFGQLFLLSAQIDKFALAFRPQGLKFEESEAKLLMETGNCNWGFQVGDFVKLSETGPGYYNLDGTTPPCVSYSPKDKFIILGFARLEGKTLRTGVKVQEVFCALARASSPGDRNTSTCQEVDPKTGVCGKTLLFWPGCLEKTEE